MARIAPELCRGLRSTILAALLLASPLRLAAAPAPSCSAPLVAHGWRPLFALAGPNATPSQRIQLLSQALYRQQLFLMAPKIDPRLEQTKDDLWASLRDFDLNSLYRLMPQSQPPWRSLTLSGHRQGSTYVLDEVDARAMQTPPTPFGAMTSQLAMRPLAAAGDGPSGDRFDLRAKLHSDVGPVRWPAIVTAMKLGLENATIPAATAAPASAVALAESINPDLSPKDVRLLAQFAAAFPDSLKWFAGIGKVDHLSLPSDTSSDKPQQLYFVLSLDDAKLKARYPQVEAYLQRLGDFMTADFGVATAALHWLEIKFDTKSRRLIFDAWVQNGRLLPSDRGHPLDSFATLEVSDTLSWETHADLRFTALGVTVKLDDWPGQWIWKRNPNGAALTGFIRAKPQVQVSGKALDILPASWLEALLPVNIEDAVNGFMDVLVHGNGGKGAEVRAALADGNGTTDSQLTASTSATLLDNFFVRIGMAMVSRRVLPSAQQALGLRRLVNDGLTAYGKDLKRVADRRVAQQCATAESLPPRDASAFALEGR